MTEQLPERTTNTTSVKAGIYRHYKGNEYEVFEVAKHSETLEELVVYRCLYGDRGLWVRPLAMFIETVEVDLGSGPEVLPRFAFVESSTARSSDI